MILTRRHLPSSAGTLALASVAGPAVAATPVRRAEPVPARHVTLRPSIFADAVAANRRHLLQLDPERLLHNFYVSAGPPPRGESYGGSEAQEIAGHTLGHWLSAASLMVTNTGEAELSAALDRTLAAVARIQATEGDGYLGGVTAPRGGTTAPGKIIFKEVRRATSAPTGR